MRDNGLLIRFFGVVAGRRLVVGVKGPPLPPPDGAFDLVGVITIMIYLGEKENRLVSYIDWAVDDSVLNDIMNWFVVVWLLLSQTVPSSVQIDRVKDSCGFCEPGGSLIHSCRPRALVWGLGTKNI